MKMAVIGDIHGEIEMLEQIVRSLVAHRVDVVAITGDLSAETYSQTNAADYRANVMQVLHAAGRLDVPVGWVLGNHDDPNLRTEGCIDGSELIIRGVSIYGLGGSPRRFGFPYEWEDVVSHSDPAKGDVLIAHTPPLGTTLDRLATSGRHAGSRRVRELSKRFALVVSGHIHEGRGVDILGTTICYNAGALGAPFGEAQFGIVEVDKSAGTLQITVRHLQAKTGKELFHFGVA